MRVQLRVGDVDLESGTVTRDGGEVRLREKERQLLAYLVVQAGRTVPRSELYEQVWGYHPATASRTLDSTVRRLRKAIERNPRSPVHVLSEVGVGYRFAGSEGVELPAADALVAPWSDLDTPYVARPADEAAVRQLLQAGWAVVTVVGPGGVGKTRLARQVVSQLERDVVAVHVGAVSSPAELWQRLAVAAGSQTAEPGVVAGALAHRGALVVIDEAEGCLDAVREVVDGVGEVPVLITSQAHLGLRGEAVHQLEGMTGEVARAFLADRLAASRWAEPASEEVLDHAVALFDGLPLGLELAASRPEGLQRVLEEVESEGRTLQRLHATLHRSYEPLSAPAKRLLRSLAVAEASLSADDLADWLGEEAALALEELAERSMVERRGRGWRLLRTTRRFARSLEGDDPQGSYDAWLAQRAQALELAFLTGPKPSARRWRPLLEDQLAALARLPADVAATTARALFRYYDQVGPGAGLEAVIREAGLHAPTASSTVAMQVAMGKRSLDRLVDAESTSDPIDQVFAYEIRTSQAALTADPAQGHALAELPGLPAPWRAVARLSAHIAAASRPGASLDALRAHVATLGGLPGLRGEAMQALAELLRARQAFPEALSWLDQAVVTAEEHGLHTHLWVTRHYRARTLGDMDPTLGADAFMACLQSVERLGGFAYYDRIRAGLLRYLEGRLDEAEALLATDAERTGGETQILARVVRRLIAARSGGTLPAAAMVVPEATATVDPHTDLRAFLRQLVDLERGLLEDPAGDHSKALAGLRGQLREGTSRIQWQLLEEVAARASAR